MSGPARSARRVNPDTAKMYCGVVKRVGWRLSMSQNVSVCLSMVQNVSKCLCMSQHVSECLRMSQHVSVWEASGHLHGVGRFPLDICPAQHGPLHEFIQTRPRCIPMMETELDGVSACLRMSQHVSLDLSMSQRFSVWETGGHLHGLGGFALDVCPAQHGPLREQRRGGFHHLETSFQINSASF